VDESLALFYEGLFLGIQRQRGEPIIAIQEELPLRESYSTTGSQLK
jgi:hypothetical protein